MKTVTTLTLILMGFDGCDVQTRTKYTQEFETVEECRLYVDEILPHEFVLSATCTETKTKGTD